MYGKMRAIITLLVITSFCFLQVPAFAAMTDEAVLGNERWRVTEDGDLVPGTDDSYDIGSSDLSPATIYLGGVGKTSWGSVVSPMTDATGYVYPTDSGGVYRLYDAGYLSLGGGTAIDTYILFDTDDDDWHIGRDDTDNDFAIGVGSTLGTDERISITDDATATIVVIGDGVNAEDKQITIDGNECDFYIAYDDSADDLLFGVDATVGSKPCMSIQDETTPVLYLHNGLDGFGAVDIDYGSVDVTDHTFVSDGGTLILDGTITLTNSDIISNATDDTVRVASNDADTILEVYTPFDTTGDATLKLSADKGDEAGEQWTITSTGATTDLVIGCDDTASGTPLTRFTISDSGAVTTVAAINAEIDDAANTSITDVINIQHFTSGTAAAGIGAGLTFDLENGAGTEEEHGSIDLVATTSTNGAEDDDFVFAQMCAGTLSETLRLVAADADDAADKLRFTANTSETNGIVDVMEIKLDTSGTPANNLGAGISIQIDDATPGVEEQASLDFQVTDSTTASENCDMNINLNTEGTVRQVLGIDTDATATDNTLFTMTSWTIETDGTRDVLELVLDNTADTATDDFGLGISISMEDEDNAAEQQASIDFVLTDAGSGAEDCDVIFSQNVAGAITERVRMDADGANLLLSGATPSITIGDGGAEDTKIVFDGTTLDYYIGLDDTGGVSEDLLTIGYGSALGTTPALAIDTAANVTITNDVTFRTSLLAMGRISASSSLASSSTSVGSSSLPYGVIRKFLGAGAEATTLPNGISGQVVNIVVVVSAGGVWTITPTNSRMVTSFTMTAADDSATLLYLNDTLGWIVMSSAGSTAITYNTGTE